MPQGRLFVVAGPSGAGKGTLIGELLKRYPSASLSVSATTRRPRPGEVDGLQYYFLDEEEFRDQAGKDMFLEWAEVHGNLYGTPRAKVEQDLAESRDVILEIDVQGARQVREKVPGAVAIFVHTPSLEVLEERLRKRGTEEKRELERRLRNALEESREKDDYDYAVLNDEFHRAVEEFCAIYERESPLAKRN
ncbi:MAG: guanylate kinase [Actinobacteria bacterium]|jgi:guanylate kinase|nr:MAG: guanylate kinase [Actinomycetota bacterium]